MAIEIIELDYGTTQVVLSERLDAAGSQNVAMDMYYIGISRNAVILDLGGVSFLASLGIRNIVSLAKNVQKRGGKVTVCSPTLLVEDVLTTTGVNELVKIYATLAEAELAVRLP